MKIYVQLCLAELLDWEMFQTKVVEETKSYLYSIFFSEYHVGYEIMWKNMVEPDRPCMPT
jgi:hypothetical protein